MLNIAKLSTVTTFVLGAIAMFVAKSVISPGKVSGPGFEPGKVIEHDEITKETDMKHYRGGIIKLIQESIDRNEKINQELAQRVRFIWFIIPTIATFYGLILAWLVFSSLP